VLVLDAFSGDSFRASSLQGGLSALLPHLKPEGVLAVHVSNRFVDLTSVVARGALSLGRSYLAVLSMGVPEQQTLAASWVLVTANREFLALPVFKADGAASSRPGASARGRTTTATCSRRCGSQ